MSRIFMCDDYRLMAGPDSNYLGLEDPSAVSRCHQIDGRTLVTETIRRASHRRVA